MSIAIIDTSVYLEHFRHGSYKQELQAGNYLIRNSSVVLAELYRGCRRSDERDAIDELAANFPVITPTEGNWLESGALLARLYERKGYHPHKLTDLHFDVLIALTARSCGATVITANRSDFQEIKKLKDFKVAFWG